MTKVRLIEVTALAMREKIAQCVAKNPRKVAFEFAERIRSEIMPVTVDQAFAYAEHNNLTISDLDHCADAECLTCGAICCPHGDPLHFHHDGCPACEQHDA